MGIFDNIKKIFKKEITTKQAPITMMNNVGYSAPRKDSYQQYAQEGYQQNAVVYKCINEIANGASAVDLCVYDDDIKLDAHPLLNLLDRPNPLQAGNEYFKSLYSFLLIAGNSYALRVGAENGEPRELYLLRPDRVKVKPSNNMIPRGYIYEVGGKVIKEYDVDPQTGQSEVKHFKLWNPIDDYYGLSPIHSASTDIDQHNFAAKHNVSLLMNGARPSGAIVFKPKDESGQSVQLTEYQRAQLLQDMQVRFQGTDNSGRPMLLEGDFDWKEMGLSPKDMDFLQLKNMSARDIAMCFGVPSQLIGIPDAQTYSNIQEARLALYEETIIPLIRRVESDLNEYLAPLYGESINLRYDIDSIPAMAERRKRIYENVTVAVREGIISRNEARERLGLEPISGGDDVYIAANLFPLGEPQDSPLEDEKPNPDKEAEDAYGYKTEVRRDVFTTREEAEERANEIGCQGTHFHDSDGKRVYMPCASHSDYRELTGRDLKYHTADPEYLVNQELRRDVFTSQEEAEDRAEEIGCEGFHTHNEEGDIVYMPCRTHEEYTRLTGEELKQIDLKPTEGMATEAKRALEWRKEFKRGGTAVGVARANQLVNRENLSERTVLRMYSFFSRHEVDKQAEGFSQGEKGYPSAGRIAWGLWGGDAGFTWSTKKREQINREIEKLACEDNEEKAVSGKIKKALEKKVKDHNDKHGDKKGKRVTVGMLGKVFVRGVGAYRTNPQSVRPNVTGPDQWGLARVNAFLFAVRSGRFRSGQFDRDLLPKDHPLYRAKEKDKK
tara:strand:- start:15363 stop:17699 length:2337 start_codon:yes stop_codon:yes gene_type:complete